MEATAWALLSPCVIAKGADGRCVTRARDWLLGAQRADGSWPAFPGQPQGCWVTSIAAHALLRQGGAQNAVGARPALAPEGVAGRGHPLVAAAPDPISFPLARQDSSLRGWSWTPGTASWVEPTAHALLFLRSLPAEMLPPQAAKRRQLAERMLFDRMCPGGGWNSGNPLVYGVAGVPRIGPTAWALLALRDHAERAEIQMSLDGWKAPTGEFTAARRWPWRTAAWRRMGGRFRRSHPHSVSFTPITASLKMCSPWRGSFWR